MLGLWWPWPLGYIYGFSVMAVTVVCGLLVGVLGLLYLVSGLLGEQHAVSRDIARLQPPDVSLALGTSLIVALGIGMVAGLALVWSPWSMGRPVLPRTLTAGLAFGLGGGLTAGCAAGCVPRLPRVLVIGTAGGVLAGLAAFRLLFGPTAGFGHETDVGVGTEVGLVLGLAGGLAGGLVGTVLASRVPTISASGSTAGTPARRWLAIGLGVGALTGLAVAVAGWLTGLFQLRVPYFGGFTDCSQAAGCGPASLPVGLDTLGIVYGLALFAVMGGLVGGLAGALSQMAKRQGESLAGAFGRAAGWIIGLASGLSAGLEHGFVGGPAIPSALREADPVAGLSGLIAGAILGLVLGALVALAFARAARQSRPRLLLLGAALVAVGVVMWTLPAWYLPLKVIDVP